MMQQANVQTVQREKIQDPILKYALVSKADVNRMTVSDAPLPLVMLARVDGKLYPIGGFAVLEAAEARYDDSFDCLIRDYDTKENAVRAGLLNCSVAEPINILKARQIVKFFGDDVSVEIKSFNMGGTFFEKIVNATIIPEIFEKFEGVLERLSAKLPAHMLALPPYILMNLAKTDSENQLVAFESINDLIPYHSPASQFTWPAPEMVSMAIRNIGWVEEEPQAKVIHVEVNGELDVQENEDTPQILRQAKGCLVIPRADGSHLIIDRNAETVKEVKKTDDCMNFEALDVKAEPAMLIPPDTVEHLSLADTESHSKNFDSPETAITYLRTLQKTAKISLFWTL